MTAIQPTHRQESGKRRQTQKRPLQGDPQEAFPALLLPRNTHIPTVKGGNRCRRFSHLKTYKRLSAAHPTILSPLVGRDWKEPRSTRHQPQSGDVIKLKPRHASCNGRNQMTWPYLASTVVSEKCPLMAPSRHCLLNGVIQKAPLVHAVQTALDFKCPRLETC